MFKKAHTKLIYLIKNTFTASLCHQAHRTIISERLRTGRTARRVTLQTLDVQYMTQMYAIGYPGPVFNHLDYTGVDYYFAPSRDLG